MGLNDEKKSKFVKAVSLIVLVISSVIVLILDFKILPLILEIPELITTASTPSPFGIDALFAFIGLMVIAVLLIILIVLNIAVTVCWIVFKKKSK